MDVNDEAAKADSLAQLEEKEPMLYERPVAELSYEELSQGVLEAVRDKQDASAIQTRLASLSAEDLAAELDTKEKKLAFWINIYNGYIQTVLSKNPELYEDRKKFFSEKLFTVAGKELSFELVEHGIIRGSESKILMGYAGKLFVSDYEKKFRIDETDPRIHFAINCGAIDCPPVYTFNAATIDSDLEQLARSYLQSHSTYDAETKVAKTTPLLKWFRGDFQKFDGLDDFLTVYGVIPDADRKAAKVEFNDYDWTLKLNNFG